MKDSDPIREARWLARAREAGLLVLASGRERAAFVCTREGEPVVALPEALEAGDGEHAELVLEEIATLRGSLHREVGEVEAQRFERLFPTVDRPRLRRLELDEIEIAGRTAEPADAWRLAEPGWVDGEQYILDHMNDDHVREMNQMCRHVFGIDDAKPCMLAVDPEGMHLRAGGRVLYFRFDASTDTVREVAIQTVMLTHRAQAALGERSEPH